LLKTDTCATDRGGVQHSHGREATPMARGIGLAWMLGQRSAGTIVAIATRSAAPVDQQTAYGSRHMVMVTPHAATEQEDGETIHT
jgi:hypothetical protein